MHTDQRGSGMDTARLLIGVASRLGHTARLGFRVLGQSILAGRRTNSGHVGCRVKAMTSNTDSNTSPLVLGAMFMCVLISLVVFVYADAYSFERICKTVNGHVAYMPRGKVCMRDDGTTVEVR
jgi:hypothetical protein